MNMYQKTVLFLGMAVLTLMLLYPPGLVTIYNEPASTRFAGYAFLLYNIEEDLLHCYRVDVQLHAIQLMVALFITVGGILIFKKS